jgi:stringent starvation protein B
MTKRELNIGSFSVNRSMEDTGKVNPYESPKSSLLDKIEEKLSKRNYGIYLSITQPKPSSDVIQFIQLCYRELLRIGDTVYIRVDADKDNVEVPKKYVEEGRIILNITPGAITNFSWHEDSMEFTARFKGKTHKIELPLKSLLWIYSPDTGTGYELNKE